MSCPKLLLTVNNSIGNIKNHLTVKELYNLFTVDKPTYNDIEKYAIDAIQTEATSSEIDTFKKTFHISDLNIKHVFSINPYP